MDIFSALAHPQRRQLLDALIDGEQSVGELSNVCAMSQPVVSKQLRILRDAGLVGVRVDAQRRQYRIEPAALREIDRWLERYRRYWSARLDALETHLTTKEDQ
ncbi:MAG TPA: metalloregulator ArsR/SmtB family transcription factor [Nitrolancea sp.]